VLLVKLLHLVRHAKSSWDDPFLDDVDRPLSERGRRDAALVAAELFRLGVSPALVLCSPARRTTETLAALAPCLADVATTRIEGALYGASDRELLDVVRATAADVPSLMLIGHNPGMHDLALRLVDEPRDKFPTCAVATIELDEAWRAASAANARLVRLLRPRELR
jgi:phosphohistidine phosphatase